MSMLHHYTVFHSITANLQAVSTLMGLVPLPPVVLGQSRLAVSIPSSLLQQLPHSGQ